MSWFSRFFKKSPAVPPIQFAKFTELTWGDYFWEGRTVLPAWAGFQTRLGPYASESAPKRSTGEVQLSISSPNDEIKAPPTPGQEKAFLYVRANDEALKTKILKAVYDLYPEFRQTFSDVW